MEGDAGDGSVVGAVGARVEGVGGRRAGLGGAGARHRVPKLEAFLGAGRRTCVFVWSCLMAVDW